MRPVQLIFVGGFLGSGKTTLLLQAAKRLCKQGKRVALLTNDQAPDLVDTNLLARRGLDVAEVAGGTLAARFDEFVATLEQLSTDVDPDVILAEPAGSSVDLAATVLQPARRVLPQHYHIAPYSVLIDPIRLRNALRPQTDADGFSDAVRYVYRKQLDDADVIIINKVDLLSTVELDQLRALVAGHLPGVGIVEMAASSGMGVDAWTQRVLHDQGGGQRRIEVDYDQWRAAEAELCWLQAAVQLQSLQGADWHAFCRRFLEALRNKCALSQTEIGHIKLLLTGRGASLAGNLTGQDSAPVVHGPAGAAPPVTSLIANARVQADPAALRDLMVQCLHEAAGDGVNVAWQAMESCRPAGDPPCYRCGAGA